MASDLKGLIQESLGPLPRVCQEQVMLDLERARMTAEDYRQGNAVMHRYVDGRGEQTWRQMIFNHVEKMDLMNHTISNIANVVEFRTDASARPLTDEDCFTQIRTEVQAHGFFNSSDDEMSDEEPDDTVMAAGSEEESEADDALHCVLCRTSGGHRMYFNMEPQGRWAGLAPGARIVCDMCYRDDMGEVESFF